MEFDFIQFLKQLPFSRLVFSLIAGILFALNFPVDSVIFISIFISVFILFLISIKIIYRSKNYNLRWIPGLLINILIVTGGAVLLKVNKPENIHTYGEKIIGEAVISEPITEKENSFKSILQSVSYKTDNDIISESSKIIVYFSKNTNVKELKYGDKIIFSGRISELKNPGNPHEFDYKKYLYRKGITGQIFLKSNQYKCVKHHCANPLFDFAYKTRCRLERIYEKYSITGNELSVLQALTLGDRSEIDDEIRQAYVASGAMHILAVSGLHIGIIYWLFNFLLGFLNKLKIRKKSIGKLIKAVILIIILWSFAILSGLSPSIRRAAIMFTFVIIGQALSRHVNIYNSISASAFILLIINPYQLTDVGFQLSYTAVLSIIFFQPKIVALITIKNKTVRYFWSLTAVSIAAQIGTFPITLYYFHIFPILFFVSNIIVIPAATLILIGAFLLLFSSSFPYIPECLAFLLKYILKFLNASVSFIEKIPYSTVNNISFHNEDLVIAFLLIISLSVFILLKKVKSLQISLILLIFWIGFGTFRKLNNSKSQLIVYNVNKFTAIDILGKQNYFLSNKRIINTKNISYSIHPNRLYLNKSRFQFIPIDTANYNSDAIRKKGPIVAVGNKIVLLLSDKNQVIPKVKPKLKVDCVILSDNLNIKIKTLTDNIDFETLIFDSSNNFYKLKQWKEECFKLKQSYFSVKDKGAFKTDF